MARARERFLAEARAIARLHHPNVAGAAGDPQAFSHQFYERAFASDASLRALFPADMTSMRTKVVDALQTVIRNARAPEQAVPMLEDLGERHHRYEVEPAHFEVMGQALLGTLAERDQAA